MENVNSKKRKMDDASEDCVKRVKISGAELSDSATQAPAPAHVEGSMETPAPLKSAKAKGKQKAQPDISVKQVPRHRIKKLVPPRPFPSVPTSVSATGPRSSHREGKNMICLTRKSSLSNYMRRCKDVIINDGYKTLHLSAMGAAIPLLLQLITALPPILPFAKDEIHYEIRTRTVEAQDEIIPDDEDEDITYQTRGKSVLDVDFKIGDGEFQGDRTANRRYSAGKSVGKTYSYRKPDNVAKTKAGKTKEDTTPIVFEEPEQDMMDML